MRKLVLSAAVGALFLASAPAALAGPNRADSYYTVRCTDPGGNPTVNESVDAKAIEQGGKLGAIANFNANHEGWTCWAEGPFGSSPIPPHRADPPSAAGPPAHAMKAGSR